MKIIGKSRKHLGRNYQKNLFAIFVILALLTYPNLCLAIEENDSGKDLFIKHCSGCHINGENIIRRKKNLKLKALKRWEIDNPEAIARIAREGIGSMSGYKEVLGEGGDQLVARWIWMQAQNAWTHG